MIFIIVVTILAVILSGIFSGSEIAYVQSSKVRVQIDATSGGMINSILRKFSNHEDMFISTLLVGNNIILVIYGITFSMLINPFLEKAFPHSEPLVLICNTIISTGIILMAGEFFPKATFRINPNNMMRLLALPLYLIYLLLYPITLATSSISRMLMRMCGMSAQQEPRSGLTIAELDNYLQHKEEEDPESVMENEVKIFRNAIDFKDTRISECMSPRNEIVAVNIKDTERERLQQLFTDSGRSKIVVFDEDIDNVVGYIHVSELFSNQDDWRKGIKPVIYTPQTMLANKMMRRMLAEKKSLTIVVDEFGGTAGLVTLEDLVEEIFGEIEDEHDNSSILLRELDKGIYEVSGRAEIENINETLHLDLPESEDYNTLAGYILENLEALPQKGDSFCISMHKFTILQMSATRIELVKIEPIEEKG